MAKSGTHSLVAIFQKYRAMHEPQHQEMLRAILADDKGALSQDDKIAFLSSRDRQLRLELDVSQLNYFFLVELVASFPDARFILTIRDCYSWLDSFINHQLGREASDDWKQLRDLRFYRDDNAYAAEERLLVEKGLYTLDGYFSYWATHNRNVLGLVLPERLLVIRLNELSQSLSALAQFVGVPVETLASSQAHVFPAQRRFGILQQLNRSFLESKANRHCGELMKAFFPDVGSLDNALAKA